MMLIRPASILARVDITDDVLKAEDRRGRRHEVGDLTWDDAHLRADALDPQTTVKGHRMSFGGLQDAEDIVAYLKTLN
jgi:hypothetical protein